MLLVAAFQLGWAADHAEVRGMTVSTPTWGWEWASPAMDTALDDLQALGVNWIAIHPYARIGADGSVTFTDPEGAAWLEHPIEAAHARGMSVMIKPHLAYWGSPFGWRGEIRFEGEELDRFFRDYESWIVRVAQSTRGADAFVVGTELDSMVSDPRWVQVVHSVREVHPGHLTYAANWDKFTTVPFWGVLDCIGVQAYFPVHDQGGEVPAATALQARWKRTREELHALSEATGKPVVFTELGYNRHAESLSKPWETGKPHPKGEEMARLGLQVALAELASDPILRGAFLWKWFPGSLPRGDFRMSSPSNREVIREAWASE